MPRPAALALVGALALSCALSETPPSVGPAETRDVAACDVPAEDVRPADTAPIAHAFCFTLDVTLVPGWERTLAVALLSNRADDPLAGRTALVYLAGDAGSSSYYAVRGASPPPVDLGTYTVLTWSGSTSGDGTGPCDPGADEFLTERSVDDFAERAELLGTSCAEAGYGGPADLGAWAAAEELEAIRATLGIDRFDMLTLSYGTAIAEAYLYSHPDHVRRAVLDAPVALQAPWLSRLAAVEPVLRDGADRLAHSCSTSACLDVIRGNPDAASYLALRDAVLAQERRVGDSGLTLTPVMYDQATEVALRGQESSIEWVDAVDAALGGDGGPLWRLGERLYVDVDLGAFYRSLCSDIRRPERARDYAGPDDEPLLFAYASGLAPCASFPNGVVRPAGMPLDPSPDVLIVSSRFDPLAPPSLIASDDFLESTGSTCETSVPGHTSSGDPSVGLLVEAFLADGDSALIAERCRASSEP